MLKLRFDWYINWHTSVDELTIDVVESIRWRTDSLAKRTYVRQRVQYIIKRICISLNASLRLQKGGRIRK